MGASRAAGSRLLGFLSDTVTRGASAALRALNLGSLAGRPVEDIFLGISDYVCPDGGTIDEGIARDAFIETIADLAECGIADFNALTADQMQTVFEFYASHAIMARLCNDIGSNVISFPSNVPDAQRVQTQLLDFIRGGVSDALTQAKNALQALTPDRVQAFVEGIYEQAFTVLKAMGDEAGDE